MCWSTGLAPMAHPPGRDTLALPNRARSGPRTRIEARIVFTISYVASAFSICLACNSTTDRSSGFGK